MNWLARFLFAMAFAVAGVLLLPKEALAAETGTFGDADEDGQVISWEYDATSKTLTLSGTGEWQDLRDLFGGKRIDKVVFKDCKVIGSMGGAFKHESGWDEGEYRYFLRKKDIF